ncbi:glycosyltransferase [Elusimicrobiota bacterium]
MYCGAEVFVFPSLYEGFGLPPMEAMACGCPVVASNNSSLVEIIGDAGVLVDPLNINDISESISRVLTDYKLRDRMIEEGLNQSKKFQWEKTAGEVVNVYNMAGQ